MESLQAIFPDKPEHLLRAVLGECNGDVEEAVEILLSGRTTAAKPKPASSRPHNQVEADFYGNDDPFSHGDDPASPNKGDNLVGSPGEEFEVLSAKSLIRQGLRAHINNPTFSDVVLVCDGEEVFAHQCILMARCEYFYAILASMESAPDGRKRFEMDKGTTAEICTLMLDYLYTDRVVIPEAKAHHLLLLADSLGLDRLRQMCEGAIPTASTYSKDIFNVLDKKEEFCSDLVLKIEGRDVYCHKVILTAASEYFKAMLTGHMVESKSRVTNVPVTDVKFESFFIILEAIYRDGILPRGSITPDNAVEQVILASKFMVEPIQTHSEDLISNNLDVDNVCELLEVMWELSSALKHQCLQFIFLNYPAVELTQGYKELPEPIKIEILQRYDKESEDSLLSLLRAVSSKDVQDLKGSIRREIFRYLTDHLKRMKLDDESGVAEAPFLGDVQFEISNLAIYHPRTANKKPNLGGPHLNGSSDSDSSESESDDEEDHRGGKERPLDTTFLALDDVEVTFSRQKLRIIMRDIKVEMRDIQWKYRQLQSLKKEDRGTATATASNIHIELSFDILNSGLGISTLQVNSFSAIVGKFDLKFANSSLSWLYNIFAKLFSGKIKTAIEKDLNDMFAKSLTILTTQINEMATKLMVSNGL